jgi:arabinogalactan oligomer/maltooligosaccharide transport system substrate-binding protein
MYPLQTSFGAPVFESEADGSYTKTLGMKGEAGEAFAQYLQKLGKDGVLDSAIDGEIAKQAFIDGKSPFIVTGPWNIADFEAACIDLAVTEIPSAGGEPAQPFVGVQGAYISAKSENPLLANDFVVNYLSTEEAADTIYASGNRIPALTASADKIDNAITKSFAEVAAQGAPMPSIPEMGSVWAFWGSTEVAIISGSASDAAGAWNTMNENIEGAIAGN